MALPLPGRSGCSICRPFRTQTWFWRSQQTRPRLAQAESPTDPAAVEFFEKKVRPLLAARCQMCHGPDKQKGNLRLDSRSAVLKGGDTGPAILPGKPDESLLVDAIRYGETYQMPPKSQLPAEEIATLVDWVRKRRAVGASRSPARMASRGASSTWPPEPRIGVSSQSSRSIRRGARRCLGPDADRSVYLGKARSRWLATRRGVRQAHWLRRVTYDLIGLPPTPAEIDAFLADDSPTAYRDRSSTGCWPRPHYGERWARHWLDLVRYAETHGHEFDYRHARTRTAIAIT